MQKKHQNSDIARVLARIHKVPTDWYDPWKQKITDLYPVLKEAHLGSHVWLFTCSIDWYEVYAPLHKIWQDFSIEPVSQAGKKIVTNHGDFHHGNILGTDGI